MIQNEWTRINAPSSSLYNHALKEPLVNCGEIHNNGCERDLSPEWRFCPSCGSRILDFDWVSRSVSSHERSFHLGLVLRTPPGGDVVRLSVQSQQVTLEKQIIKFQRVADLHYPVVAQISDSVERAEIAAEVRDVLRRPSEPTLLPGKSQVSRDPLFRRATIQHLCSAQRQITVLPELVVSEGKSVSIFIRNESPVPQDYVVDEIPADWQCEIPDRRSVLPNQRAEIVLSPLPKAENGTLSIRTGNDVHSVTCVHRQRSRTRQPRFIVGIDFGTSSTSVAYLDTALGSGNDNQPRSLGLSKRFSTNFYLPTKHNKSEWLYGESADRASINNPGMHVPELKAHLRAEDSLISGPDEHDRIDAVVILAWYFSQLLKKEISPTLSAICGSELDSIEILWRISVPVLFDEEKTRYEQRVRRAFDLSLKTEYDILETVFEPDAALRGILSSNSDGKSRIADNQSILIVDSGAGTTDLSYGTIQRSDGKIQVSVVERSSIVLEPLRSAGMICSNSFGGGDVTRLAASYAISDWAKRQKPIDTAKYERALKQLSKMGRPTHWMPMDDYKCIFPTTVPESTYWHNAQPDLYRMSEAAKLSIVQNESSEIDLSTAVKPSPQMTKEHLAFALKHLSPEFSKELSAFLDRIDSPPNWIFYLGGNMECSELRANELPLEINTPDLTADDRRLAVIRGLTQHYEHFEEVGVLTIQVEDDSGTVEECFRSNPHILGAQDKQLRLDTARLRYIEASLERDGREYRLMRYPIAISSDIELLTVTINKRRLKVTLTNSSSSMETLYDQPIC